MSATTALADPVKGLPAVAEFTRWARTQGLSQQPCIVRASAALHALAEQFDAAEQREQELRQLLELAAQQVADMQEEWAIQMRDWWGEHEEHTAETVIADLRAFLAAHPDAKEQEQ